MCDEVLGCEALLDSPCIPQTGPNAEGISFPDGFVGILGIAQDDAVISSVEKALRAAWGNSTALGRTVLSNLFAQNDTLGPFFDLSLGRIDDIEDGNYKGTWITGSHSPEFAAIEDSPRIPQVSEHLWAGIVDGFMVNGRNISLGKSVVAGTAPGKLVAVLDSGSSDADVPFDLADAIYEGIPGTLKVNGTWYVPCYMGMNATVVIGYVEHHHA